MDKVTLERFKGRDVVVVFESDGRELVHYGTLVAVTDSAIILDNSRYGEEAIGLSIIRAVKPGRSEA